jgi:alpha/beta hydrolase fold
VRSFLLLAALVLGGCAQQAQVTITDRLKPCTGDDAPVDAVCGTLKVYENRATRQGRQIDLNIVVLPALRADARPDPLFFLAGGPGQGAAKMAKMVREMYRQVLTDRDIVLVDQRGTGKSNPLNCEDQDDSLKAFERTEAESLEMLKKCMAGYDADLRLYTTTIAMDDLDDVRAFLGYDKINIYGGSYGTRITSAPRCSTAWRRPTCGCRCSSRATCSARSTCWWPTAPPPRLATRSIRT